MRIPSFRWANGTEVWNCMLEKDATYSKLRSEKILERHPTLLHSYRTILFDWLSEVSHECKFHRETYHLALDFIDRYLAATNKICKYQLQLIGTTCLFLAAKYEEIRPPTVIEFAELTDGACKAQDIIDNEVVILSAINWDITPMTPNSWLNIYMQILLNPDQVDAKISDKSIPAASKSLHKRIASVIDLAILHIDSLRFKNSILAAAAVYHFTTEQCSRYTYKELAECIRWLKPFVETIKEIEEPIFVASCKGSHPTQMHTHIATAILLEQVLDRMTVAGSQRLEQEEDEEGPTASLKRKAYCLDEGADTDNEEALVERPAAQVLPSSTILLTPPSSTSKVRKQLKRHHNYGNLQQYRCQGVEISPPPPQPPRQPLLQQQQQQPQPKAQTQKISVL